MHFSWKCRCHILSGKPYSPTPSENHFRSLFPSHASIGTTRSSRTLLPRYYLPHFTYFTVLSMSPFPFILFLLPFCPFLLIPKITDWFPPLSVCVCRGLLGGGGGGVRGGEVKVSFQCLQSSEIAEKKLSLGRRIGWGQPPWILLSYAYLKLVHRANFHSRIARLLRQSLNQ
jgi:hypothetical protein